MSIETIRKVHDRLLAAKLRKELGSNSEEPPDDGKFSRPWYDRLCSWCGKEYNLLDKGTMRHHCCRECSKEYRRVGAEQRDEANREKRRQAGGRRYATRSPKKGAGK